MSVNRWRRMLVAEGRTALASKGTGITLSGRQPAEHAGRLTRMLRDRASALLSASPLDRPARRAYAVVRNLVPDALMPAAVVKGRDYDRMTLRIAARVLADGGSAIDAGANEGGILRELVKMSSGPHWAFEPAPALAARLQQQFPGTLVHEAALSDHTGEAEFRFLPGAPAYSSLLTRPQAEGRRAVKTLTVSVRTLDGLIPEDARVAFVKIDVEGAEAAVLRGARRLLARCQPVVVFECASAKLPECIAAMDGTGLRVSFLADYLAGLQRPEREVVQVGRQRGEYYYVASRYPFAVAPEI